MKEIPGYEIVYGDCEDCAFSHKSLFCKECEESECEKSNEIYKKEKMSQNN